MKMALEASEQNGKLFISGHQVSQVRSTTTFTIKDEPLGPTVIARKAMELTLGWRVICLLICVFRFASL